MIFHDFWFSSNWKEKIFLLERCWAIIKLCWADFLSNQISSKWSWPHLNTKLKNKNPTEPFNFFTTQTFMIFNLCSVMKLLLLCEKNCFFCHLVLGSLVASCCMSIGKKTQQDQGQVEERPHLVPNLDYRLHRVVKTGDEISENFLKES